jgi:hypothetical protein
MTAARRAVGRDMQDAAAFCPAELAARMREQLNDQLSTAERAGALYLQLGRDASEALLARVAELHGDVFARVVDEARAEREQFLGVRARWVLGFFSIGFFAV